MRLSLILFFLIVGPTSAIAQWRSLDSLLQFGMDRDEVEEILEESNLKTKILKTRDRVGNPDKVEYFFVENASWGYYTQPRSLRLIWDDNDDLTGIQIRVDSSEPTYFQLLQLLSSQPGATVDSVMYQGRESIGHSGLSHIKVRLSDEHEATFYPQDKHVRAFIYRPEQN
ncbi:MAG TPA: hypothetical protein VEF04_02320 [Blastocatellia bacterium]|nr:hypothetical protein [Blastocatellia bacterium]